ncbi:MULTISPECIES: hypothetical protein [unclassified Halomonas]|uniref:hypothetical protein n=1 Tax=unclassified Halomonas TaxID=2609666 RepID=UPI000945D02B|nr:MULTISPECIES: hypothetical protein [unclassified Halomonas]
MIKQSPFPIVAIDALCPVQLLNQGARQAQVGSVEIFFNAQQVHAWWGYRRCAKRLAADLAAEGQLFTVESGSLTTSDNARLASEAEVNSQNYKSENNDIEWLATKVVRQ